MRHNLTGVALEDLLLLVNTILGVKALPSSKYLFLKMFSKYYNPRYNFFCKKCLTATGSQANIGDDNIKNFRCVNSKCLHLNTFDWSNDSNYFITFPLQHQLQETILKNSQDIIAEKEVNNDKTTDIHDGLLYKNKPKIERREITLILNTDGVQIFKSKSKSLWPVQLIINEIHRTKRFMTKNILVVALWFHAKHPNMKVLLKPLIEEMIDLKKNGLKMMINNVKYIFNVTVLCTTLDAPAKASVQNIMGHSGYSSCHYCEVRGVKYGVSHVRYPYSNINRKRSHKNAVKQMIKSRNEHRLVLGFKGISPLIAMPDFNVIDGFAIDYMHAVLLGIVKRLLKLWFDPQPGKDYNIRKHMVQINERILNIKLPSEIERKPRPITEKSTWKANELRAWLVFYSVGILNDILPTVYLEHYMHLVIAIRIYLQSSITHDELLAARNHILCFVGEFEKHYGLKNMVYNTHTIQHLPDCVDNLGPIWVYSNFAFENNNGKLMRYVNSPKGVLKQIWSKYSLSRKIQHFKFNDIVTNYKNTMTKKSHLISSISSKVLGKAGEKCLQFNEINLTDCDDFESNIFFCYKRFTKNNIIFATQEYCNNKKSNDSVLKFNNNRFGIIMDILVQSNKIYLLINEIDVNIHDHLKIVNGTNKSRFTLISEHNVDNKCVFIDTISLKYLVNFNLFSDKD